MKYMYYGQLSNPTKIRKSKRAKSLISQFALRITTKKVILLFRNNILDIRK